jgi:hypothetical protein
MKFIQLQYPSNKEMKDKMCGNYFCQILKFLVAIRRLAILYKHIMAMNAYYTLISDRDQGLLQALKEIFPTNHTTQCSIHIQWNVLTKFHSSQVALDTTKIARTFSSYQEKNFRQCSKTI